jgi:hypothetical protein
MVESPIMNMRGVRALCIHPNIDNSIVMYSFILLNNF